MEQSDRRYGHWAGNPAGVPEDPERCIEEVPGPGMAWKQCARKRGHGRSQLYCWQHARQRARVAQEAEEAENA